MRAARIKIIPVIRSIKEANKIVLLLVSSKYTIKRLMPAINMDAGINILRGRIKSKCPGSDITIPTRNAAEPKNIRTLFFSPKDV